MGDPLLVVSVSSSIEREIDVVRRHFGDVEHHIKNRVHPDVEFIQVPDPGGECRFRKRTRVLGVPITDEVVLKQRSDGSLEEHFIAGPSTGMRLISGFTAEGPQRTLTTLTVEVPMPGLKRIAAPWLRSLITQRLSKALAEDRRDLELGVYPS